MGPLLAADFFVGFVMVLLRGVMWLMSYRDAPPRPPLVIIADRLIQAFDRATGQLRWEQPVSSNGIARVAVVGELLIVSAGRKVRVVDVTNGRNVSEMDVWFEVEAMLSDGDTVVLTGNRGLACFNGGGYAWGIKHREVGPDRFFDPPQKHEFWLENSRGEFVTMLERFAGSSSPGLVLGAAVFQPDRW
jgi:hypothetical protein